MDQKNFFLLDSDKVQKANGHKPPQRIQKKLDSNIKLTQKEQDLVNGYRDMEEDLKKEPKDRKRGVLNFLEGYDLLTEEDCRGINFEDESGEDSDSDPFDGESDAATDNEAVATAEDDSKEKSSKKKVAKAKVKPTKSVKRRRPKTEPTDDGGDDDASNAVVSSDEDVATAKSDKKLGKKKADTKQAARRSKQKKEKPKIVKKNLTPSTSTSTSNEDKAFKQCMQAYSTIVSRWKSSVKNKDAENLETLIQELDAVVDMFSVKFAKHHDFKQLLMETKNVLESNQSDVTSIDALSSKLWKSQSTKMKSKANGGSRESLLVGTVDFDGIGDEDDSHDDSGDDNNSVQYALEDELPSSDEEDNDFVDTGESFKTKKSKTASKPSKQKIAKKAQVIKHKLLKPPSYKQLKRTETEAFRTCERDYLPMIRKWESALENQSLEGVQKSLTDADRAAAKFSFTFIVGYDLSDVCKDTKKFLKSANADLSIFAAVKEKIKATYEKNRSTFPDGFIPTKAKNDAFHVDTKSSASRLEDGEHNESQQSGSRTSELKPTDDDKYSKTESSSKIDEWSERSAKPSTDLLPNGGQSNGIPVSNESSSSVSRLNNPTKPERKKFTLNSFMQTTEKDNILLDSSASDTIKPMSSPECGPTPLWMQGPVTIDAPLEHPRSLALEFLLQMTEYFPEDSLCVEAFAQSLEGTIYAWAKKKSPTDTDSCNEIYWAKVHSLVAAICGKDEPGSLQNMILRGQFNEADKLVSISDDMLAASFEGRPV